MLAQISVWQYCCNIKGLLWKTSRASFAKITQSELPPKSIFMYSNGECHEKWLSKRTPELEAWNIHPTFWMKTSQELRMLSSVTINCKVKKIVRFSIFSIVIRRGRGTFPIQKIMLQIFFGIFVTNFWKKTMNFWKRGRGSRSWSRKNYCRILGFPGEKMRFPEKKQHSFPKRWWWCGGGESTVIWSFSENSSKLEPGGLPIRVRLG